MSLHGYKNGYIGEARKCRAVFQLALWSAEPMNGFSL